MIIAFAVVYLFVQCDIMWVIIAPQFCCSSIDVQAGVVLVTNDHWRLATTQYTPPDHHSTSSCGYHILLRMYSSKSAGCGLSCATPCSYALAATAAATCADT